MSFFRRSDIVNVRMVITEEKILSNIEKVQKLINPNSKKQIVQLEDDSYFKDLVEAIKTYLVEYPKKKNFPKSVYKAAYDLVEYATSQFEENTKKIEELIRKRENNIVLADELKSTLKAVKARVNGWGDLVDDLEDRFGEDIIESLNIIGRSKGKNKDSENVLDALKLVEGRINNLESNLHIGIDMERIEDRSKALSYIGIEIAEALKYIPAPVDVLDEIEEEEEPVEDIFEDDEKENVVAAKVNKTAEKEEKSAIVSPILANVAKEEANESAGQEHDKYLEDTRFEVKPSLWQRIKNSKIVRKIRYIMRIRIVLEFPELPEGRDDF